jgi:hypothetical protein
MGNKHTIIITEQYVAEIKFPKLVRTFEDQHTNKKQPIKQNKDTEILTWKTLDVRVKNHGSSRPKK